MWPPPHFHFHNPVMSRPPLPMPVIPHPDKHPPRTEPGESWKSIADNDSWRSRRLWSNYDMIRQQYSQLPLSRPYAQLTHSRPYEMAIPENRVPSEYAAQIDYEKQLREQYEKPQNSYNDFSNVAGPKKLQVHSEPSARKVKIGWKLPLLPSHDDRYKIKLIVRLEQLEGGIGRGARKDELGLILNKIMPMHVSRTEFDAIPGSLYSIELNVIGQQNEIVSSAGKTERAMFSIDELKVLMQKAINFTGTQMQPFTFVYRCKPKIYWDYIYNETDQIMCVYEKDSNGQAASPINQNIQGLFFSARTNPDGSLPNSSPFGDVRMVLPAMTLLDPWRVNLYFSDFYCNRVTHYVTVVVAVKDSTVDSFCRDKLIPLMPFDNPFLLFQQSSNPEVPVLFSVNKKVWVEIYYTENVPMRWGRFDNIIPQGAGTSKIGGLPHNKSCRTCNLYPIGAYAPPPPDDFEQLSKEKAEEMVKEAINADLVDLVDSDEGSFSEEIGQPSEDSLFGTYDQLKMRLEQLDHSISSRKTNGMPSHEKMLTEMILKIRSFMETSKSDLTTIDARIGHLENTNVFAQLKSTDHLIPWTVNALIDNLTTTTTPSEKRSRKLSSNTIEISDKRLRRDSL